MVLQCRAGEYLTADDVCTRCDRNCARCEDLTGDCTSCESTFILDADNECVCPEDYDEVDGRCEEVS